MFAAKSVLAAILAIGVGYAVSPYVTLYRLGHAVETGDAATLRGLVNWPAVREGIKEDICDDIAEHPAKMVSDDSLPPFGASFARGIVTSAVDQTVTAQGLVDMTHRHRLAAVASSPALDVTWAFFRGPTDFIASLHVPGQPGLIKLQMTLKDAVWQVTRIWLPHTLLQRANGT